MTGESLCVPLNGDTFRKYRNLNALLAGMGLFMVLLCFAGLSYFVYLVFRRTHTSMDGWCMLGMGLSLWLVVFIGIATIPAWQLAQFQTRVLVQNAPALIVDKDGIIDNASNYGLGRIAWAEIEGVITAIRYAPNINKTFPGIAIVLKNKKMLLQKKPKILAMWMEAENEIREKRQVFIPQGRIDVSVDELVAQINEFRAGIVR